MSTLPPSWETFVTTFCNTSAAAVKYSEKPSSILSEDVHSELYCKSRGSVTCNYCKKPGHVKTECRALTAKNGKHPHKGSRTEEVNFCVSSSPASRSTVGVTPEDDPNILNVDSMTEAEVLLTTEDATSWSLIRVLRTM
jgi:hypothetical protein